MLYAKIKRKSIENICFIKVKIDFENLLVIKNI